MKPTLKWGEAEKTHRSRDRQPTSLQAPQYAGIAVLRLPSKPSAQHLVDLINVLVGGLEKEKLVGRLWMVERGRIRISQKVDETIYSLVDK